MNNKSSRGARTETSRSPAFLVNFIITLPCSAFAGNNNSFFLGSDASLAAGATAAVVHDSEGIWYNPAGLGGNSVTRGYLCGNAFLLRLQYVTNGIETVLPSGTVKQDLHGDEYLTVPTAMTFMTSLSPNLNRTIRKPARCHDLYAGL